jgi:glycosyltransferase involved in cell wall biosynthesis
MRYLLITHIPFARSNGAVVLDGLWAEDLKGLVGSVGPVTIAAPEERAEEMQSWGPGMATLGPEDQITFVGLPKRGGRLDFGYGPKLRSVLRGAVEQADLVHTSNLFHSDTALYYAHDLAVRQGKETLFVVAEDFVDMQLWEWIRPETHPLKRWRQERGLKRLNREVEKRVQTSSLTFLHTPAAVSRYRLTATNAIAIRQPVHEEEDVIAAEALAKRSAAAQAGRPLVLSMATRMASLKGVDFAVRAAWVLKQRGIAVRMKLYGGGVSLDAYKALATRLEVTDVVEFPGSLSPQPVLYAALREADVFLMPHLTTDFGRAFFDAMASGCPVIAFRSAASVDTVRHGVDGLIVPNADAEALADGIEQLHKDRGMLVRMSGEARERALRNTKRFWNGYRTQLIRELFAE